MAACGIWRSKDRLVAVVVDDDGRAAPTILAAMDNEERWALLQYVDAVHGLDCALVLTDDLLKADDDIRHLLLNRSLWPNFEDDNALAMFWALDRDERAAIWGEPFDIAAVSAGFQPDLVPDPCSH